MIRIKGHIFQMGAEKPPTIKCVCVCVVLLPIIGSMGRLYIYLHEWLTFCGFHVGGMGCGVWCP